MLQRQVSFQRGQVEIPKTFKPKFRLKTDLGMLKTTSKPELKANQLVEQFHG